MRKSVAVLLAAYNGEDWLEEQLASILEQAEVDLTVYISLDDSSDRSREIVKKNIRGAQECYSYAGG